MSWSLFFKSEKNLISIKLRNIKLHETLFNLWDYASIKVSVSSSLSFIHYAIMSYFWGIIWMCLFLICPVIEKQKENNTVWCNSFSVFFSTTNPLPSHLNFIGEKKHNSCLPLFVMSWQIQISGKLCNLPTLINSKGHSDLVFL